TAIRFAKPTSRAWSPGSRTSSKKRAAAAFSVPMMPATLPLTSSSSATVIGESTSRAKCVITWARPAPVTAGQVRRTVALVVDDLALRFEDLVSVREALRQYVERQMQPGDLVGLKRTGGGVALELGRTRHAPLSPGAGHSLRSCGVQPKAEGPGQGLSGGQPVVRVPQRQTALHRQV